MDPRPYLRLLRLNPDFTRLYAAQLITFAGEWFGTVALLGLVQDLAGSAALLSLVLVLQTGPFFLLSPVAGILADRFDRRRLLMGANMFRAVAVLGFLLVREPSALWIAFLSLALVSAAAAFFEPTSAASLPNLVEPHDLPTASVLLGGAWGTMVAVGAALGGVVAAAAGRDVVFVLNSLAFAVGAILVSRVRRSFREPFAGDGHVAVPRDGVRGAVRDAIGETMGLARRSRLVAALMLTKATFGVGMGAVLLLAIFADDVFHAGDAGIGLLFAARGLGAVVGPFLARRFMSDDDRGLILVIAAALASFLIGYALLPVSPTITIAALAVFFAHLGGGAQWTLSSYGLQRLVPDRIRGRVFSFDFSLALLAQTSSVFAAGLLAAALGPHVTLYLFVGLLGVAGLAWLAWSRPIWRRPAPLAPRPAGATEDVP